MYIKIKRSEKTRRQSCYSNSGLWASVKLELKSLSVSFSDKNALKKEQNFIIHEQKSLAHHVIYKQSLSSLIHCALICTNSPFCKSVNFISEQGGNFGECQLNDATAEDFPFHLMRVSNSVYSVVYSSWDRIMLLVQHCLQGRRRKGGEWVRGEGNGREWESWRGNWWGRKKGKDSLSLFPFALFSPCLPLFALVPRAILPGPKNVSIVLCYRWSQLIRTVRGLPSLSVLARFPY